MKNEEYDAILSDWIVCTTASGSVFLAGCIDGDRKDRFPDGRYITTSFLASPVNDVAEGQIVSTFNSRYRLGPPNTTDAPLFAKLDAWLAEQPTVPTILDVLAAGDRELSAAYILRAFRQAAAKAVAQRKEAE